MEVAEIPEPAAIPEPGEPAPLDDGARAELVDAVRRWVRREVVPAASELEANDRYPERLIADMADMGLFGLAVPPGYGGVGVDLLTYAQVIEEIAAGWMTLTGVLNTHTMVVRLLLAAGSPALRTKWLPLLASGEVRGAFSLSEPDAGSDAQAISCRAERDGDEWVVTGTKAWVTNGERAGLIALAVKTPSGISCLLVDNRAAPRPQVTRHVSKLGYRGIETVEMFYDGLRVPVDHLIGAEGRGFALIMGALEVGRINIAARAVGVARCAYEAALGYSMQRHAFGKPLSGHQGVAMQLAEMATKLTAARLLTHHAARTKMTAGRADVEAGMAKLFASETALELATSAMRIHGGVGYTTDAVVERLYRDAPLMIIGEGTNDIQRLVIARGLLARAEAADGR